MSAINTAMTLAEADPATKLSTKIMRNLGARFLCTSCPSCIVMDFKQIVSSPVNRHTRDIRSFLSTGRTC